MNEISWSSINTGDVFLLVAPKYIFIWTGQKSNRFERLAAINIANELKNELARFHLSVVILDDGQESDQLSSEEHLEFNRLLPLELKDKQIKSSDEFDWSSDEKFESNERQFVHLYRCKEEDGKIDIQSVKDGPLTREDLDSNVSAQYMRVTECLQLTNGILPVTGHLHCGQWRQWNLGLGGPRRHHQGTQFGAEVCNAIDQGKRISHKN